MWAMRAAALLFFGIALVGCQSTPPVTAKDNPAPPAQAEKPKEAAKESKPTEPGLAIAKDESFTLVLPKGWVPLTGEAKETIALKMKMSQSDPQMAQRLTLITDNPMVLFYAVDTALMDGKTEFVDNLNVNVQETKTTTWTEASAKEVAEYFKKLFEDNYLTYKLVDVEGQKVFRYRYRVAQGGQAYENIGYQYLHANKVYTVTLSSGYGKMNAREKEYDKIGTSLRFKS